MSYYYYFSNFADDLLKLQLELINVKDRLDRTERDNVILRNRVDILSDENFKIRAQLRRMLSVESKTHKTFNGATEDTDSLDPDQGFQYGDDKINMDRYLSLHELGSILDGQLKPKYDRDLEDSSKIFLSSQQVSRFASIFCFPSVIRLMLNEIAIPK